MILQDKSVARLGAADIPFELDAAFPLVEAYSPDPEIDVTVVGDWVNPGCRYECRVILRSHEHGGFSAKALRFPGVVASGATESEALKNIADAFRESFAMQTPTPWGSVIVDLDEKSQERWILVDVGDDPTDSQSLRLIEDSGVLDFWKHPDEDKYTLDDGEPL